MAVYAYLRVSTDQQDVDNQRYDVLVYVNTRGLGPLQFIEDTASGRLAWRERAVGRLLTETTQAGDVVLFAEVSRMARSTLQVLEMLACCMQRGVHVHIAKQQMVLDGSLPSRVTATVLGLAAEIEREFIALRTREALAKRRAAGKPLGRPKGKPAARLKLDAQEAVIRGYLAKGINKLAIAKLLECAPSTLYAWLARRNGFDHGAGHPLLFLDDAKVPNCRKNNGFMDLGNYSEWPKVAGAVIKAGATSVPPVARHVSRTLRQRRE